MITSRRAFLTGLGATLITAPAIVRPESLMRVKTFEFIKPEVALPLYQQLTDITRRAFVPRLLVQTYYVDPVFEKVFLK